MNTHIIPEPVGLMKKIARDAINGHWKELFIGIAIYTLLTGYVKDILSAMFPYYKEMEYLGEVIKINISFVGYIYEVVLTGAFMYGLALFMLTFFRTRRIDNKLLFEGFSMIGKTILLQIVISVFVFLWSLLLVIPGIIAAIRYSQAFYILADHPEYSVTQCINESKARMRGNCGTYFILMLSFIGWAIVASIASGLITRPFLFAGSIGGLLGELIGLIPFIFLGVYVNTAKTVFYELLTQNLVVMVPDQHVQDQGVRPENVINANYEVHEEPEVKSDPITAAAGAAGMAADKMADIFPDEVKNAASDAADKFSDVVSDVTDKAAEVQEKVEDKIDDFVPDTIMEKVDDLADNADKTAAGAPDVPVQVYEHTEEAAETVKDETEHIADTVDETVDDTVSEFIDSI